MKKALSILLALVLLIGMLPMSALALDSVSAEITGVAVRTADGSQDADPIETNETYTVRVTVRNTGTTTDVVSVTVYEVHNDADIVLQVDQTKQPLENLAPDESASLDFTWIPHTKGGCTLKAEVWADAGGTSMALDVMEQPVTVTDRLLDDTLQAQLRYYETRTLWAPLTALGVYSLTRDVEQTGGIPLNADFTGSESAYTGKGPTSGSAEAMAAIDAMARGQDPRQYYKIDSGMQASEPSDLIAELLSNLGDDGNFKYTVAMKPAHLSITNTHAILTLEMYYAGDDWRVEGGNHKQTRTGAIETYLESFVDAKFKTTWEIFGGRMIGPTNMAGMMSLSLNAQLDAAQLLARWVNDETEVRVNGGESQPLKDVAKAELDGLMRSFSALYGGNKGVDYTGNLGTMPEAIKNQINLPQYISALIATGQKDKVEELGLMDTLLGSFATQEHLDDPKNINLTEADLGGYFYLPNANVSPYISVGSVWRGSVALGDYKHGEAAMATFVYSPELNEIEAIARDLDTISLPSTATENLTLPTSGRFGSEISWTSSNEAVINPLTGAIARPAEGEPDIIVTLTANASFGQARDSKIFVITVPAQGISDKAIVNADASAIKIPLFVTENVTLPSVGENGSSITWNSSDTSAIAHDGTVSISSEEKNVTLTATISSGSASTSKIFEVTVGKEVADDDLITKAVYKLREYYGENRNLTGSYWDVWMAKSALREDFDKYGFTVYNLKNHKPGRTWAGTDLGAAILQIVAQGDNPYNYQGMNYVQRLLNYIYQNDEYLTWGAWTEPIFLFMGLEAAGAMTPELLDPGLRRLQGMLASLNQGADYGGWAMIPITNYVHNTADSSLVPKVEAFRQICLGALEHDPEHEQYGLIGGYPYAGYSAVVGTNSVLSGAVGAMRAGIDGWDFLNDGEWIQEDGTNIIRVIYEWAFENPDGGFRNQAAIAFADLYHGSNVWVSENPTPDKLSELIETASTLLSHSDQYTDKSVAALQNAYEGAKQYKGKNYEFGQAYFALRDAIKGLKNAGSITVSILGTADRQTILSFAPVDASGGTYFEILQKASIEYGFSFTPTSSAIMEVSGISATGNGAWYLYDGQNRVANLNANPVDGAELTLKYCGDTAKLAADATLDKHLVLEAADALNLGDISGITGDIELPGSGLFGTSIVWLSDKPLNLTNDGKVTRGARDVSVTLTATITGPKSDSTSKTFTAIIKGTENSGGNPEANKKYAYISVVDPKGKTFYTKKAIEIEEGETAYTLLVKTGLELDANPNTQYGVYVAAIGGWGEFSDGPDSGWMYRITHGGSTSFPGYSAAYQPVSEGDYVEWLFTRDLGKDIGNEYHRGDARASSDSSILAPKVTASNGTATVEVMASDMTTAIAAAKDKDSNAIVIAPEITGEAKKVRIKLPKSSLSSVASETSADLTVKTPVGNITIPNNVLSSIARQAVGSSITVSLEFVNTTVLTLAQEAAVGNNPVYDISIMSGGSHIPGFSGRSVTVSLPHTLKTGEDPSGVTVWYLSDAGELEKMTCAYDRESGMATFTTTHLSYYAVGYTEVWQNPFSDVKSTDWFYGAVEFAVKNGLFKGTSATAFSPDAQMTRAMLVTVLYRREGSPTVTGTNGFADVKSGEWYTDAVVWANKNGIVTGYSSGLFSTNDDVTREQMAAILYRYSQYKGYDVTKTADLSVFIDASGISSWAQTAMNWANAEGLINGRTTATLAPKGSATRAEVATVLQRFAEGFMK